MVNSLTQSLFGSVAVSVDSSENDKKTDQIEGDSNLPLSQLFDSSSTLPDRPQHFDHATPSRPKTNDDAENLSSTAKEINKNEKDEKNRRNPRRRTRTSNDDENSAGLTVDLKDEDERTIFVGNLPKETTRKSLASIFRSCGKVQSTRLRSVATAGVKVAPEHAGNQNLVKKVSANTNKLLEDTPKKTAQGYVVFEAVESVQAALRLNGTLLPGGDNLRLRVDHASPTIDSSRSVFVGNLRYGADESTLRDHFIAGCGWEGVEDHRDAVKGVRLIRDAETQQCKGFGYVLLKDASYVSDVLKTMNGSVYMDRSLRVMVCGSRFKGKRGIEGNGNEEDSTGNRGGKKLKPRWKQHEKDKQRAEKAPAAGAVTRKGTVGNSSLTGVVAKKKKRGAKKKSSVTKAAAGRTNGISKRAAAGKKREKRVNKLQKRMTKGMGKMKK